MTTDFIDLDVRPLLRSGAEPFGVIMEAVAALAPGQGLRLLATFRPVPLFTVMEARGFVAEASEIGGGDWQVLFRPASAAAAGDIWPVSVQKLDLRGLVPAEAAERLLAAADAMPRGQVLSARFPGAPDALYAELERHGHEWRGAAEPEGEAWRLLVRAGTGSPSAA